MAVKSVLEIDVRDASFRSFAEQFRKYTEQLNKSKSGWQNVNVQIKGAKNSFDKLVFDAIMMNEQQRVMARAQKEADRLITHQAGQWRLIATSARSFSQSISGAVTSLVRAIPLVSAVSGVLGIGSLFGLERLAGAVAAGRRSSQGLNATYGEQRSFGLNFERLVDAPQFLASVNEALHSANGRTALYGAGLSEQDLAGKNTAQVAASLLPALKRIADRTPDALLGNTIGALHLGELGIGVQDLVRLKSTPPAELAGLGASYQKDAASLNLQGDTQKRWQDFYYQLERAGQTVENVFIKGLEPLIPGLTKLSDSVAESLKTLLGSVKNEDLVTIGQGIEWLASKIKAVVGFKITEPTGLIGEILKRNGAPEWTYRPPGFSGLLGALGGEINDLPIKKGAGARSPELLGLARSIYQGTPGIDRFTSFNDAYHQGTGSAHASGNAFDFTIKDPAQAAAVAEMVRSELRAMGRTGTVIDEYNNPSSRATGGHIHVQTDLKVKVENPAGANVFTSANSIGQTP